MYEYMFIPQYTTTHISYIFEYYSMYYSDVGNFNMQLRPNYFKIRFMFKFDKFS